jgi:hypothetical protein
MAENVLQLPAVPWNGEDNSVYGKRRRYERRYREVDAIYRASWLGTHCDIIDNIQPNRGEFLDREWLRGERRDQQIYNNTASDASDKLGAAMDTGITSEAREWHTYAPEEPTIAENDGVREYCHLAQSIMFALISKSGFYVANRNLLDDLITVAVGLMLIDPHPENVWQCEHVPIGSYRLTANSRGKVNGVYRHFSLTAAQMFEEFGEENLSIEVLNALRVNLAEQTPFRVLHVIEERSIRSVGKLDGLNKPWVSAWLEMGRGLWTGGPLPQTPDASGGTDASKGLLRESGYDEQPFIAPRWRSVGRDPYGKDSPGWKALGDVKGLQALEFDSADLTEKIGNPPLNVPDGNFSLFPGALNRIADTANAHAKAEPTIVIEPNAVTVLESKIERYERRIDRSFYGDVLFLLSRDEQAQPKTAEEVRGQKEERLLQLGGVFARYADEALKPGIARMFAMAQRAGKLPPPPPELARHGKVKIDFQNPLITAQKTIGFTAMGQLTSFSIGVMEAVKAGADKLDPDEMIDTAADMLGVKPNVLKSDDQLAQERQQKQQAAAMAQAGAAMPEAAGAIKDLSNVDPDKLRSVLSPLGPNAVAQGVA